MMHHLSALAPAKINLTLHVTGKRDDGYHFLESLITFVMLGDIIEVKPADTLTLKTTGPFAAGLPERQKDNVILKVANLLREHYEITEGAAISVYKELPVASGVGGGSTDAATTARLLALLWNLPCTLSELDDLLIPLGADIPACLHQKSLLVRGVGEVAEEVYLPPAWLVLCNPGKAVSTTEIFSRFRLPATTEPLPALGSVDFIGLAELTRNDLTDAAISYAPEIVDILDILSVQEGCDLARMSGSGATCYGVFSSHAEAAKAMESMQTRFPGFWVRKAPLLGN